MYTYCQNNPILYHDPTGHGTKENSPYSRNEQRYIDAGADPDTARLAAQCYPDAKSKQDLYNKYKKQGYSAQDAKKLANREIIHGEEATKKYIKDNNVKKSGPDYTATSPRDNVNTDWRTQERLNAQRNAGAGKGNESGNKTSYGKSSEKLNWDAIVSKKGETRVEHIKRHTVQNNSRETHSVFNGNPIDMVNDAWEQRHLVEPISDGMGGTIYNIPYKNAGYESGYINTGAQMDYITIVTLDESTDLITAFPSFGDYHK